jgi:hypothetical protein
VFVTVFSVERLLGFSVLVSPHTRARPWGRSGHRQTQPPPPPPPLCEVAMSRTCSSFGGFSRLQLCRRAVSATSKKHLIRVVCLEIPSHQQIPPPEAAGCAAESPPPFRLPDGRASEGGSADQVSSPISPHSPVHISPWPTTAKSDKAFPGQTRMPSWPIRMPRRTRPVSGEQDPCYIP